MKYAPRIIILKHASFFHMQVLFALYFVWTGVWLVSD